MNCIQKIILIITLSQLGACAVISKKDCLDANWHQIGYRVGLSGNIQTDNAFRIREKSCAKHGATANWNQFEQGHDDGLVQYCQLDNAVRLGVNGVHKAIDYQICPERDYPGFTEAFSVGYKLHELRGHVHQIDAYLSDLQSKLYHYQQDIKHINEELRSNDLDKSKRKSLKNKRHKLEKYSHNIKRDIRRQIHRLNDRQAIADHYAEFIYEDYLLHLSNEFIDPRKRRQSSE